MELATSPSLYKLNVVCAWRDSDGDDDFNLEAATDLASGLAPNLKEVSIVEIWPISCWSYDRRRRPSWQGLPGLTDKVGGSLTSWTWVGCCDSVGTNIRRNLSRNIDFSHLKHLTIGRSYDTSLGVSGDDMKQIVQNRSFPQLKTLSVALTRDDHFVDRPDYVENAILFFQTFRPLEELSVCGPIDAQILGTILSRHGETLRKLTLHPDEIWFSDFNGLPARNPPMKFTTDYLSQLAALCPQLEQLSVPIKRNESRACEVELYKCFSRMKNLRSLFLILDCSNPMIWLGDDDDQEANRDEHFGESAHEPVISYSSGTIPLTRGEVKRTLTNCAVDESLAREIWDTISQGKEGRRLESLKVWPRGTHSYPSKPAFFDVLVEEISRTWLLERSPRDDQVDPVVRELGKLLREYRQANMYWKDDFQGITEQIFREIWPCKPESKDWRDDWSSFPLEI